MDKTDYETIGMCHLSALPGDINFKSSIKKTIDFAKKDIETLQKNGITKILFSNEFGYPYTNAVDPVTSMAMAYIIGNLKSEISVPFGVDCMYDPFSTIDLAIATEANFYRLTLPKSDTEDYLLGETKIGQIIRRIMMYKELLMPELFLNVSIPLNISTSIDETVRFLSTVITQINPFGVCVSSNVLLNWIESNNIVEIRRSIKNAKLFCDGGCCVENIKIISQNTNGTIIGKSLKKGNVINNPISSKNVRNIIKLIGQ